MNQQPDTIDDTESRTELEKFRSRQFALWRAMRLQGNPWLITDFFTLGTPMYFADLLYTRSRSEFAALVKRAELPMCPPIAGNQMVEREDKPVGQNYGYNNRGREVLVHGAPFAVVRWTNLYFPAALGFFGDWFGGPLRPLFGRGILDHAIVGNKPGRFMPGAAHSRYFSYPRERGSDDVAGVLQEGLSLTIDSDLEDLLSVGKALRASDPFSPGVTADPPPAAR